MNSAVEEKQILLAELISNYEQILLFVKTKIPEEELDIYLDFFSKKNNPEQKEELIYENTRIVSLFENEVQ